jgi:hypothetical protein
LGWLATGSAEEEDDSQQDKKQADGRKGAQGRAQRCEVSKLWKTQEIPFPVPILCRRYVTLMPLNVADRPDARRLMSEIALKGSKPIKEDLSRVEDELLDLGHTLKPRIPGQQGWIDELDMDESTLAEHRKSQHTLKEWRKELKHQREDLIRKQSDRAEKTKIGLREIRLAEKKATEETQDSALPPPEHLEPVEKAA